VVMGVLTLEEWQDKRRKANPKTAEGGQMSQVARKQAYRGRQKVAGLQVREDRHGEKIFEARLTIDGKQQRVRLVAKHIDDAVAELHRLQRRGQRSIGDRRTTVAQLARTLMDGRRAQATAGDRSARAVKEDERRIALHILPTLGHLRVVELTRLDVEHAVTSWTATLTSVSARRSALNLLRSILDLGVPDIVETNPANAVKIVLPKTKTAREGRSLSKEQIEALLQRTTPTFKPLFAVLAQTGLRVSEALGLQWGDLDGDLLTISRQWDGNAFVVPKSAASKATIRVPGRTVVVLRQWQFDQTTKGIRTGPDDRIFTTSTGVPQSRRNALRAIQQAAVNAKLGDVQLHDLRHSCGSQLLAAGVPIPQVSAYLRHRNPAITMTIYARELEGAQSTAAAALDEVWS
jgi:integrase